MLYVFQMSARDIYVFKKIVDMLCFVWRSQTKHLEIYIDRYRRWSQSHKRQYIFCAINLICRSTENLTDILAVL